MGGKYRITPMGGASVFGTVTVNTSRGVQTLKMGDLGSKVLPESDPSIVPDWKAGSTPRVAWGMRFNHGGGYQYRLCPAEKMPCTEEDFQAMPLDFVKDAHAIMWNNGTLRPIQGKFVDDSVCPVVPAALPGRGTPSPASTPTTSAWPSWASALISGLTQQGHQVYVSKKVLDGVGQKRIVNSSPILVPILTSGGIWAMRLTCRLGVSFLTATSMKAGVPVTGPSGWWLTRWSSLRTLSLGSMCLAGVWIVRKLLRSGRTARTSISCPSNASALRLFLLSGWRLALRANKVLERIRNKGLMAPKSLPRVPPTEEGTEVP